MRVAFAVAKKKIGMRRLLIFTIFYFLFLGIRPGHCQIQICKFEKSTWVTTSKDSAFYRSDSIRLVQIIPNTVPHLIAYFGGENYVELVFKKRGKLSFGTVYVEYGSVERRIGKYSWKCSSDGILTLKFNGSTIGKFRFISEKQIEIRSLYIYQPKIVTTEVLLERVK